MESATKVGLSVIVTFPCHFHLFWFFSIETKIETKVLCFAICWNVSEVSSTNSVDFDQTAQEQSDLDPYCMLSNNKYYLKQQFK